MLFAHLKRILKLDRLRLRGAERGPGRVPPRHSGSESQEARHADPGAAAEPSLIGWNHLHIEPQRSSDPRSTQPDREFFIKNSP